VSDPDAGLRPGDEARLAEIVDVVVAIASNDFSRRATVREELDLLDGLATGINMLAEEIARQQAREQAARQQLLDAERLAALGQLAAGIAHEINNPASFVHTNLLALLALLERAADDPSTTPADLAARALAVTRDCVTGLERIAAIVRDMRGFVRPGVSATETLDPDELVEEACQIVRAEIAYRARLVVRRGQPPRVHGDRVKLIQVLTNLLVNAAHAIPEGASDRHVVTVETSGLEGHAVIRVSDTGVGIDPSVQPRIFDPFVTTRAREGGLGLGLWISADTARRHGGSLSLEGSSPEGTTIALTLPSSPDAVTRTDAGRAPVVVTGRPRVLLIDDETALLVASRRLYGSTYDLTTVSSGLEAIALMEQGAVWDAVICDLMMPAMDGAAVFDWIRQHRPDLVPRLLFTSGGAFTPRGTAFADEMGDRILQKPMRPDDFHRAVARARGAS